MKKHLLTTFTLVIAALFLIGCDDDNNVIVDEVPPAPQGVYSVTGDGEVFIYWNSPYDHDIDGFAIYRSNQPTTGYVEIDFVAADNNPNLDLLIYEYIDDGCFG